MKSLQALRMAVAVCTSTACLCLSASPSSAATGGATAKPTAKSAKSAISVHAPLSGGSAAIGARGTSILGAAWSSDNTPIPDARLRLRDVLTGKIVATTVANELGQFSFAGIASGSYVIELVSDNDRLLTIGQTFTLGPGETVATFVRLGSKAPWFDGFFRNAATAIASAAASTGVTAIAPEKRSCVSACAGQ